MNTEPLPRYTEDIVVTVTSRPGFSARAPVGFETWSVRVYSKRYGCTREVLFHSADMLADMMKRALHDLARAIGETAVFGWPKP